MDLKVCRALDRPIGHIACPWFGNVLVKNGSQRLS